jgi:hypothetical protein
VDDAAVSFVHFFQRLPERKSLHAVFISVPAKITVRRGAVLGTIRYNMYEKKALAFHIHHPGHLARKLFIEVQAGDTAGLFEASVASALAF